MKCGLLLLIAIIFLLQKCFVYTSRLNGSEFARMPPIFHLDPYETCLHEDNDSGVYCYVNFDLVTDEPSELYTMIREYSKKTEVHFNHTKLSHGICLTRTCKKIYQSNITEDQVSSLEACLNETMWKEYKLKTRVEGKPSCEKLDDQIEVNTVDMLVAALVAILVVLNIIGSLQEIYFSNSENKRGSSILSCFSISRNWRKFVAPRQVEGPDSRLTHFTGFHGIKSINMMVVIMFHALIPFMMNGENTHSMEEGYTKWYYQIIANGTLIVQTFFVLSGFLLSYNLQIYAENNKISWLSVPKTIFNRWMRLTPPYVVVLAVTATWMRFFGSGPLWQTVAIRGVEDCRRDWWYHLLYINNYVGNSNCMIHSWYLAADFQLFCLGVLVCCLTAGKTRRVILCLLFIAALLMPAVHTYLQDLNGFLVITPEMARNFLVMDPSFIHTYRPWHTNLANYVLGLATGLLVYHCQITGYKLHSDLRHRILFWLILPALLGLVLLGSVFYHDAPRDSIYLRMLCAALVKPLWGFLISYLIVGMVLQYEVIYRGMLEWPGWVVPSRASYSAYLIHMILIRVLTGIKTTTTQISALHLFESMASIITMSFLAAIPFHVLVEAPFLQLIKLIMPTSQNDTKETGSINNLSAENPRIDTNENENVTIV